MSAKSVAKRIGNIMDKLLSYDKSEPFDDFFNILANNKHILMWTDIVRTTNV